MRACPLHLLAVGLLTLPAVAQRPGPVVSQGPGYSGSYPSKAARDVLAELRGRESTTVEELLGPGPWRVAAFRPPIPYAPGPAEKDVHRLGELTIKGPHVTFESPFCLWQMPVETDGDVAFVHRLVTGAEHETLRGERSAHLDASLRFVAHFGAVVRGLRAAVVWDADEVRSGEPLRASLMVYDASGKPVDVTATARLRVGTLTVPLELGNRPDEPGRIVLEPGQVIERRIDVGALVVTDEDGAQPIVARIVEGAVPLHVELELAPDARGNRGVVRSAPSTVEIVTR